MSGSGRRAGGAWAALALTLATLSAACAPLNSRSSPSPTVVLAPKPVVTHWIRLLDASRFEPAQLRGEPGQRIKLVLVGGQRKHDLTSPGLNINIDVLPGAVEIIEVELPGRPGVYDFWSNQPGDRDGGMTGQLTIAPPAPPASAVAAAVRTPP